MNTKYISTTYIFDEEKICGDCRSLLKKDRFYPTHKNLILNDIINNKMITGQED